MQFLENLNLKPANLFKIAGVALVAFIVIALGFRLIASSLSYLPLNKSEFARQGASSDYIAKSYGMGYSDEAGSIALSTRNVLDSDIIVPGDNYATGDDAEEFDITSYDAFVETRHLSETCERISLLKARTDVIFENSNEYEKSCSYYFKVKNDKTGEILGIVESLDPRELNENTHTIKQVINDYSSELEILEKKMKSIEDTLANAVEAYDDITQVARRTQDAESLAKIIDSKLKIIERLTQEKINITAQLDRLGRAKAEQLDRIEYTYFNVYISENKFVDAEEIKDSWKYEFKSFVRDVNNIAQDVTINLVSWIFVVLQYILYLFIVLIVVKFGWRIGKRIWQK